MMGAMWKALGVGQIKDFPVDIGDTVLQTMEGCPVEWILRSGTLQEDSSPCMVFSCDTTKLPNSAEMARNAMARAKAVRLPHTLKVFKAAEHQGTIYIATEPCVTLIAALPEQTEDLISLGVQRVAMTLGQLHSSGLVHGNVSVLSVFVTPSGEYKLFGLDLTTKNDGDICLPLWQSHMDRIRSCCHRPLSDRTTELTPEGVDGYAFVCFIYGVYTAKKHTLPTPVELKGSRRIPSGLVMLYNRLLSPRPPGLEAASQDVFFSTLPLVQCVTDIDNLTLLDVEKQSVLFRTLEKHVDSFPVSICRHAILPRLCNALKFGGTGFGALELILRVGAVLDPAEYSVVVGPALVTMFQSSDITVRYKLLNSAHLYVTRLQGTIQDQVWPLYVAGFAHKLPEVRELTVKAMLHVAPTLPSRLLPDAVKALQSGQQDQECGIRTNACICMGRIAGYLAVENRSKTLLSSYYRAMKDPFGPCRAAGVASLTATLAFVDIADVAQHAMGAVGPLCVDTEASVRDLALKALMTIHVALTANDAEMRRKAEKTTTGGLHAAPGKEGTQGGERGGPGPTDSTAAVMTDGAPQGWGSWAWGKLSSSKGTTQPVADPPTPPPARTPLEKPPEATSKAETTTTPLSSYAAERRRTTASPPPPQPVSDGWNTTQDSFGDDEVFGSSVKDESGGGSGGPPSAPPLTLRERRGPKQKGLGGGKKLE